ncbi:uncharacterized protein LOC122651993 isoform X2 [Telopea speciosissima]|uniref:uncharacterized protein LOC122651993 isoform X2 n=1 Tax=Telopea speciosissima TaxID=54955 RepID=UPI001CC5DD84|nr:uncharacterized protein LOC122651993 isoform X2 [Telopea speciosissima]
MENPKREGSIDENKIEGSDRLNQTSDEISDESAVGVSSRESEVACVSSRGPSITSRESGRISGSERDLTERLRGIFRDEVDEDLLLQRTDQGNGILQWLQALDVQVMGGCRADERLKPLLKLNVSSGVTDDCLLAHISQHFEAPEVGMLARCLCIPLVTMRVGKVVKQGTLLCPTAKRGNLYITLLPTSDLRVSFAGDDGCTEKVVTLSSNSESSVAIEDIPADNSGRSFLIKLPDGKVSYFWCSEKSKLLGMELLAKMKDIVNRKPSLAQLTGISESRLDCFATHLRAYLIGSTVSNPQSNANVSSFSSVGTVSNSPELDPIIQLVPASTKPCRARYNSSQAVKTHALYQGSLSPRSNSFKDGLPRNISLAKSVSREKIKRRGDGHLSVENLPVASTSAAQGCLLEVSGSQPLLPLGFLQSLGKLDSLPALSPLSSQIPSMSASNYSPYYCWCPPCTSTLQCSATLPQLPIPWSDSLSLPTVSSLLSDMRSPSTLFPPKSSLDITDIISLDFPALLPDPVNQLPLPVSSIISAVSSQQIPTFTPLMCDPIVHILDVCSSGQGYLVSAGPAISTTIPSLHPNIVGPLMAETESVVEKGARETLRLLISSTQTNPQLMGVLPVLNSTDEKHGNLAAESRALYNGIGDVGAIENTGGVVGLVSRQMIHCREDDLDNISQVTEGPEKSCSDDSGGATD